MTRMVHLVGVGRVLERLKVEAAVLSQGLLINEVDEEHWSSWRGHLSWTIHLVNCVGVSAGHAVLCWVRK